ncbi:IS110 family transposase [Rhizobium sp.]|uniref:IS110 family transposase n=1 Tax=Rhizobium sp. TaxID=391 RepID=UPI0028B11254
MEKIATIGLDLAKQVFQVHGMDRNGKKVLTRKLDRSEVKPFFKKLRKCVVGMEATGGAHFWAREIAALGHRVLIMPGQYVKPFVKRGKTDALDAEGIAIAATQPGMPSVKVKSASEQAVITTMKTRMLYVRERTSAINALRGLLAEFGHVAPAKRANVVKLRELLTSIDAQIPEPAKLELLGVFEHIEALDARIERLTNEIAKRVDADENISRLTTIPGVGAITAAMVRAVVPDPSQFKSARHFASWLGLTPRSLSSGGSQRLGRISKRGNSTLRSLLIVGACAVVVRARQKDRRVSWIASLSKRKPFLVAAVAVANKNARVLWALMMKGGVFEPRKPAATG